MNNKLIAVLAALAMCALPAMATEVVVTITNVAPEGGNFLTPTWVGFHNGEFDSYDGGAPAADFPGLEQIAEDGNTGPLSDSFALQSPDGTQATIPGPNGPIFPGESATMVFDVDPANSRYFSYVSMVIPSNDAFIANGSPTAHPVFDSSGDFIGADFIVRGGPGVNDAGTEVNDEIPENVAALGQAAPNTGVDENGVVTAHPGFIPGGNILAAIPNGQHILPGYTVARITVTELRVTTTEFEASGDQEVPPVDSPWQAACSASLSSTEDELTVSCEHNVPDAVAAHVHMAPRGENGPIAFAFDDPVSPLSQTFEITAEEVATFLAGGFYVNIHSESNLPGEVRGQLDGCVDSPTSICLDGRFQVSAEFEGFNGEEGPAKVQPGSTIDTGLFYFFEPNNTELLVRVIDFCTDFDRFAVFVAGLTNVAVNLNVLDTATGVEQTYVNDLGEFFEQIQDFDSFATCP